MPKVVTRVDIGALLASLAAPREHDDVDQRILDAAASLLMRRGIRGLEVDDVASASGVGRSTVYRRFADRNTLISAALAQEARRFFAVLADSVSAIGDLEEQVVAAFSAGLRMSRDGGFVTMVRDEPLLLRLLTVDSGPIVAAARAQLVAQAAEREPSIDLDAAAAAAEILIRLAISFVLLPESSLDLDDAELETSVRRHVGPLVRVAG